MSFWVSLVDAAAVLVIARLLWIAVRVPVLRFAAERGSVRAQLALGNIYGSGKGADQDYEEAMRWFRKAAELGNPMAQNNLALSYATGQGIEKDRDEAVKWFMTAARNGYKEALAALEQLRKDGVL